MLVFAATTVAILVLGFVLLVVGLLVAPGRKGRLSVRRSYQVHKEPGPAWDELAARLMRDRFRVDPAGRPWRLVARRERVEAYDHPPPASPHVVKALKFEAVLEPAGVATGVDAKLTMDDFVLLDSGETAHLQWAADRLTGVPRVGDMPPVIPAPSLNALFSLSYGVTVLGVAVLPLAVTRLRGRWLDDFAFGVLAGVLVTIGFAWSGLNEAQEKPRLVTKVWTAYAGVVLATLAALVAVGLLVIHWAPSLRPAAWQ